jgi:quercetin dioxygenase-like cupin family protein
MRKCMTTVAAMVFAASAPVAAQRAPDAVAVDPTHHNVLFENDHVRVFRALASPGDRSPMHTHPSFVFVGLGTARLRMATPTAANVIFDIQPEQVLWMENAEHSWEMVAGQAHVVGVEVKAASQGRVSPPITLPASDVITVDPVAHQVVLENDYVRVIEILAGSGARSPLHTHSRGGVLISLGRSRVRLTAADGSSQIADLHQGQVMWVDPGSHSWEILSGQSRLIGVEVKSATGGR